MKKEFWKDIHIIKDYTYKNTYNTYIYVLYVKYTIIYICICDRLWTTAELAQFLD